MKLNITPEQFADRNCGEYTIKGDEIIPTYCPYCKGGEHKDKDTFALNIVKKTFNCRRGNTCGVSGTFWKLLCDFNEIEIPAVNYKTPSTKTKEVSSIVEKFLLSRGIKKEVWKKHDIQEYKNYIVFRYFEKGEHVMDKYREVETKQMRRSKGGKPILWEMDKCNFDLPLTIVEGEIDALTLSMAGLENIVSIPSGSQDMAWVKLCWEWLEQFDKVIIWCDNDNAGKKATQEIINRLGEWRCSTIKSTYKDANDCLLKKGKEEVLKVFYSAKEVKIKRLVPAAEIPFIQAETERVKSNIFKIDKAMGGFGMGELTLWTGEDGAGKSTFLNQMIVESIEQKYTVCVYAGELLLEDALRWIELQMAGPEYVVKKIKPKKDVSPDTYTVPQDIHHSLVHWYQKRLYFYDSSEGGNSSAIMEVFLSCYKRYGCKVFVIDNLMKMIIDNKERDFLHRQSQFVEELKDFARKYKVVVHLIVHPRKTADKTIRKNDISGSREIHDRADNVFSIKRPEDTNDKEVKIQLLKSRAFGAQNIYTYLYFEPTSKRFYPKEGGNNPNKKYSWETKQEKWYF